MDLGALATARIGIDAARREQPWSDTPGMRRPRATRGHRLRVVFAGALRGLADLVDPGRSLSGPAMDFVLAQGRK